MSQIGLGVMIQMLGGGDEESATAVMSCLEKTITGVTLDAENDELRLTFDDTVLTLWDGGQSCCEHRYMTCDDKLEDFIGDTLTSIEVADGPEVETEYDVHEQQFLRIKTNRGVLTVCTHNEHNGYYGGFYIKAKVGAV